MIFFEGFEYRHDPPLVPPYNSRGGDYRDFPYWRQGGIWISSLLFKLILLAVLLFFFIALMGCQRGQPTDREPIHLNPDMDYQPKYEAQESSDFFVDGASNRIRVAGTVARGQLHEDVAFYEGKNPQTGKYVNLIPFEPNDEDMVRGGERYEIYCSMCHGLTGIGDGVVISKGFFPPPNYHDEKIKAFPGGQIFAVISDGVRNMPSYKQQIPVGDRWLIVNHVRTLQKTDVNGEMSTK